MYNMLLLPDTSSFMYFLRANMQEHDIYDCKLFYLVIKGDDGNGSAVVINMGVVNNIFIKRIR